VTDVLLGQSYFSRFDPKQWEAMQPYPPLGTLYAASYLRERGHDVALFDAMLAESEEEWDAALARTRPRVAVLYEDNFNYLSKMCLSRMREAAFRMIRFARERGCTVVVAGSDPTDHADLYLGRGAHFVLRGEGEETLGELLDHLDGRSDVPLAAIRGLSHVSDGKVRHAPARPDLRDLDALPFPAWDLVDVGRYRAIWLGRHGYFSMNVATSRGCPFHCNWCAKPIWGQRYNVRSPESVVRELAWLRETYRPDHLWFVDDIFGLKPGWVQRFADLVEREGVRIPSKSLQRVDLLLKGDTVEALRRAGAKTVWVGAESGSQKILDAMDKGTRVEQIYEASRRLHAAGIEVAFFLQFGYPGETRADVEQTLRLVRECRPDDVGVSVSYPLPGTKFHHAVQQELGIKQNWVDSNDLAMLYRGPYTTAFYRTLHTVVHHEFRLRKTLDELAVAVRHPRRLRPAHARRAVSVLAHGLALPVARWRLDRLARAPHQPLAVSPQQLTAEAASRPSPQEGEPSSRQSEPSSLVSGPSSLNSEIEHVEVRPAG
jgi:anaerobic magnesium-protoporphyrin IX monomethyl ester cyclase